MCTAIAWCNGAFYFGRNMDLNYHFNEQVVIVPRGYSLSFKQERTIEAGHYAMIGMAAVVDDYPLYAEAVNEKGLCVAGLNFAGYAYNSPDILPEKNNVAPYELIPWLLSQCANTQQAKQLLMNTNVIAVQFQENLPLPTLHWLISDKHSSIVFEFTKEGGRIFDNPYGVLTNNPTFDFHLTNLSNYINCSPQYPQNSFVPQMDLVPLGVGAGGLGLPGDVSTTSRFVRAVFAKANSVCQKTKEDSISHFFHILDSVAMLKGSCLTASGEPYTTIYTSCANVDDGTYYYKTYNNNQISAVSLYKENLEKNKLISYSLVTKMQMHHMNG